MALKLWVERYNTELTEDHTEYPLNGIELENLSPPKTPPLHRKWPLLVDWIRLSEITAKLTHKHYKSFVLSTAGNCFRFAIDVLSWKYCLKTFQCFPSFSCSLSTVVCYVWDSFLLRSLCRSLSMLKNSFLLKKKKENRLFFKIQCISLSRYYKKYHNTRLSSLVLSWEIGICYLGTARCLHRHSFMQAGFVI